MKILIKLLEIEMDALAFISIGKSLLLIKLLEIGMDAFAFIPIGKSLMNIQSM